MHNPRTEAIVKSSGRIIDHKMYDLASKLENELHNISWKLESTEKKLAESRRDRDESERDYINGNAVIKQLRSENKELRKQLALERKHLTASGRYKNT